MTVPKEYIPHEVEPKWQSSWDMSKYHFDWEDQSRPQYIIDTPPPYPTGNFHIGNALNWCYIDFIARYKRMRGYNVMFPQGWDCHGLPTEVKVEELHGITKNEVSRAEFRKMCKDLTSQNIEKMRETMMRLGFSIDWNNEFVTMEPEYFVKTQKSFVQMYDINRIYQSDYPVNWCPRCETAIALAEVEYDSRDTSLNYLYFDDLEIATTRPELLPACVAVAVNPEDERYREHINDEVEVPIFGQKVPVLADEAVDTSFGTGVVMICTFGDKQDVRWCVKYDLPVRKAINKNGRMTDVAGKYSGMTISECKDAITQELSDKGHLYQQETLEQNVGLCWRCKTPIEILSEPQWFVSVNDDEIHNTADEVNWHPEYMKTRLKNWTDVMEWDWCISRQRVFATPIPVWYCNKCGETMVAKEEWLPLDPIQTEPPEPCNCGSTDFEPENDVLDTWMDSSLTALHVSGWLSEHELRLPTQIRPQGHDILRTWAFYTILRTKAIKGIKPWEFILVNGMVLGEDGHKMSKSQGNIISPDEVVGQYGADAFRQWGAVGGTPGSDVMFRWKDVVSASRFMQKVWSIYRFSMTHLEEFVPDSSDMAQISQENLSLVDKWLLSKLNKLIESVTTSMDKLLFDEAYKSMRTFAWEVLADNYLELVKSRLYGKDPESRKAAQTTLYYAIDTLIHVLAPITPFFAEEMYSRFKEGSVHEQSWPEVNELLIDNDVESKGEVIKDIASNIRRYKSDNGMALNAPLEKVEIYSDVIGNNDIEEIKGATNSEVEVLSGHPQIDYKPVEIKPNMGMIGPKFRDKAGSIVKTLKSEDPEKISKQADEGKIVVSVDGETIELDPDSVEIEKEAMSSGRAVDVMDVDGTVVVVIR
ncbi:valyl-tRNA synthetase [Methanohalobium evestigatum Z-7303]|uniref:Valine--tRNA ligase n=1 Tax=Methanohalobium evestigatum (strain ATCC BAA-1072 / DSM 3721 / NBRC 107634 / OCM 161 / Z-7303) TaxID=644295 RepID=D7E6L3_METEZ|nr:valine--tRNA ligase [Methanohalobium evestigatum]ADI73235.1 valyl-tRNA synthetase [Methanohalobium evestigatum Z-7303]